MKITLLCLVFLGSMTAMAQQAYEILGPKNTIPDQTFDCESRASVYKGNSFVFVDIQSVKVGDSWQPPMGPKWVMHRIYGTELRAAVQISKAGYSDQAGASGVEANYWRSDQQLKDIEASSFMVLENGLPSKFIIAHHRSQALPNNLWVSFRLTCVEETK